MKPEQQPAFGPRLRKARLRAGLRQADLAGPGLTQSYISHLEASRREPTQQVLTALAAKLGLSILELAGTPSRLAAGQALALSAADYERRTGSLEAAREAYEQLWAEPAEPYVRLRARLGLAQIRERKGDLDGAVRDLEWVTRECQSEEPSPPTDETLAEAATCLSRCYREAGDLHRAVDVATDAAERLGPRVPRPRGYPQLVATLAVAHADRGDLLRASHVLDDLMNEYDAGQDRPARAAAYWNASLVSADRGQTLDAIRLIERAVALLAEDDDERSLARIKITQAWLLMSLPIPDPERADTLLRASLPALERHAAATDIASAHTELARVALALADPQRAVGHATTAIEMLAAQPNLESARAGAVLGQALLALGDGDAGRQRLSDAASVLAGAGATRESAVLWRQLGVLFERTGAHEQALNSYERALDSLGVRTDILDQPTTSRTATARMSHL